MALVQPFQVPRWPFIRDVGFFTLSVLILVGCLTDGKLTLIESGGLMILYIVYVTLVVGGNWWMNRKGQNKQLFANTGTGDVDDSMRNGNGQLSLPRASISGDLTPLVEGESGHETNATADGQGLPLLDTLTTPGLGRTIYSRSRSRSSSLSSGVSERSHAPPTPTSISAATSRHVNAAFRASPNLRASDRPISDIPRPTFSLLGAIEFRDAINTLRKEGNAGGMLTGRSELDGTIPLGSGESHREADFSDYFGPISPFSSAHYHSHVQPQHHGHRRRADGRNKSVTGIPRSQLNLSESSPREEITGGSRVIPLLSTSASRLRSKSSSNIHEHRDLGLSRSSTIGTDHPQLVNEHVERASDSLPSAGTPGTSTPTHLGHRPVPSINLITAGDDNEDMMYGAGETHQLYPADSGDAAQNSARTRKRDKLWNVVHETFHVLFPALQGFRHKSLTGKILGVFASPAILALTLTLPVVDDEAEGCSLNKRGIALEDDDDLAGGDAERGQGIAYNGDTSKHFAASAGAGLHHLILDGGLPSPASGHGHYDHRHRDADYLDREADGPGDDPELHTKFGGDQELSSDGGSDGQALLFNKYLTAAQCVFGSLFCSSVFFCKPVCVL
jgi:sodium/potassium/calcium exchanger 6